MFGTYHALNNLDVFQVAYKHFSAHLILTERKLLDFTILTAFIASAANENN